MHFERGYSYNEIKFLLSYIMGIDVRYAEL